MPASLMDMLGGNAPLQFSPRDYAGNQIGMGDAIAQNSNSLVGLGMGLLQPYRPGESPYGAALQGFQAGSVADSNRGYRTAQLQHQKAQDARQLAQQGAQQARQAREDAYRREQDRLNRDLQERQFERSGESSFAKIARDLDLKPGTPEYADQARKYVQSQMEGEWQIAKLPHPTIPGDEITVDRNKRTGEIRMPQYPGAAGAAPAPAPTPADPFTAGIGQPVYGGGGPSSYSAPAAPPAAAPQATPAGTIPSSPSTAAPAGYRWGDVNPQTGRRELVPIEGGPATKLPEGAASKLAMLEAAKPGLEAAKKYFLDPKPLHLREGGDQAGGALYSMGKQYLGEKTGSFEIGRQRRNIRYGIEAALRAATGAAAPEAEVDRYTDMYAPSITDSYETRKQKIDALDRFISTYTEVATRGHGPSKPAGSPAAPSAGGVRRYNPETGKIE